MAIVTIPATSLIDDDSSEDSLDEIVARTTALAFLCRVNADYKEIEKYLGKYPECLLFESEEGNLECIVERQMERCMCFGKSCNQNRKCILRVLRRGFEYYRGVGLADSNDFERSIYEPYDRQVRELERDVRMLKLQQNDLDSQIARSVQRMDRLRRQVEESSKSRHHPLHSQLRRLQCRKVKNVDRQYSIENTLTACSLYTSSLEKELELVGAEVATARRLQHALLKRTFAGCRRHICISSREES